MNWNPLRVARLERLLAGGCSARQIANELGGFDHCADGGRSAVIGKIHRLKLSTPRKEKRSGGMLKPTRRSETGLHRKRVLTPRIIEMRRPATKRAVEPAPVAILPNVPPSATGVPGVSLLELRPHHCRWPNGDVGSPDFHFCGDRRVDGRPYCRVHCDRAFAGISPRRPKMPVRHAA
jgi:GcrA cell cycle regulator